MEELLLTTKPPIPAAPTKKSPGPPPYDRTQYHSYARDRGAAFGKLYSALFTIAKTGQSRNIDIEVGFHILPLYVSRIHSTMPRSRRPSGLCCSYLYIRL